VRAYALLFAIRAPEIVRPQHLPNPLEYSPNCADSRAAMTHDPLPRSTHLAYRLYRLRRLIALAALLILAAIAGSSLLSPPDGLLTRRLPAVFTFTLALAPIVLLAISYPRATSETLAAMIALVPVILVIPGFELLHAMRPGMSVGLTALSFGGLSFILWCGGFLTTLQVLQSLGQRLPRRTSVIRHGFFVPLPPEAALNALSLAPDRQTLRGKSGPADPAGTFDVHQTRMAALPPTCALVPVELIFTAQVTETLPLSSTVRLMASDGSGAVRSQSLLTLGATPQGEGAWIEATETHDHLNALGIVFFWLADLQADQLQASVDALLDRPSPALDLLADDSMIAALTRWSHSFDAKP
jgi:hypothetical protein